MHTRLFPLLTGLALALGVSVSSPAQAALDAGGGIFNVTSNVAQVDATHENAGLSCSVSPRLRLLRAAGTTSIITTTFAVLGALFILRRRRF